MKAVEEQLSSQAVSVNWTDPERWRDQLDQNSSFLMKKVGRADKSLKFNNCPILSLMNFIYSVENERSDLRKNFRQSQRGTESEDILNEIGQNFDEFAIWCSTKFPKLIPTIKKAIDNLLKILSKELEKYSNSKNIKAHMEKIQSLNTFNLTLRQKYQLERDPKKIIERKKREEITLKRCEFLHLIRIKIEESIEERIHKLWHGLGFLMF